MVEAVHTPTGTRYTATTSATGRFNMLNVRVGGPYTVTAKLSGFQPQTLKNIEVALGESRNLALDLDLATVTESVEVTASESPLITPDRMGSGTAISENEIKVLPTIRRQFQDLAKVNPYVNVASQDPTGTNISVGGKSNRYNTVQIDGAVNNDLFGLGATGTPGGQADTQPIALDAVQELQVVVSPYDVKQGGFTGGAINAITRGGSNEFRGSIYGSIRNEKFVADKVPQAVGDAIERPIASFDNDQIGARLGGFIIKDKLFFFVSGELNNTEQPTSGSADGSTSNVYRDPALAAAFRQILITKYNYDPGSLSDYNTVTDSTLLFGRLDFNATTAHQMTLRHNYVDGAQDISGARNSATYTFETAGYAFASKTNSTVFQINSVFGASSFNSGRVGYQTIRDIRAVPVQFPSVYICVNQNSLCSGNGQYTLAAGTERSSGANSLDQDILEVTDDFTLIKGDHTITIGTHNEFFSFKNLFLQDVYGTYYFNSLAAFDAGTAARYQISFANGSDPRKPTEFAVQQWGIYAGDQWRISNNFTLNFGLRFDLPRFPDSPTYNPLVDTTFGIDTSQMPDSTLMISPRLGFNWNPTKTGKDQVRGGIGVFAGRTPYVWISNNYGNTGVETSSLQASNVTFNPDPNNPPRNFPPGTAAIQANGVDPDFKFPQILRTTLAYDRELPFGIRMSLEGMFTKTLKDIYYYDVNKVETGTRNFYGAPTYKNKSTAFSNMIYLGNTDRGEQQSYVVQLDKRFDFGLYLNGSYAYTNSKAAFEGTSSVAYSNWRFYATSGDIYEEQLTRSQWEIRDRFNAVISQTFRTGPVTHNLGFVFTAQSGQPYSMMMGGNPNTDGETGNDLLFVPANYSDIVWKGTGAPTEAQWNEFLTRYGLDEYRGRVAERNGLDTPWIQSLDFHYDLEVPISVVRTQITFDVLNLINLIDSSAGLVRYVPNYTYTALTYSGIDADLHGQLQPIESELHDFRPPLALADQARPPLVLLRK
jgi:hypothetical protein